MNITAIIVLYNPNICHVKTIVTELSLCCSSIILIDNSGIDTFEDSSELCSKTKYIPLHTNVGIASAQNIGIHYAQSNPACDAVLFFDQDSNVNSVIVNELVASFLKLKQVVPNIASLSPLAINKQNSKPYSLSQLRTFDNYLEVRETLSSGSLVPMYALNDVGFMEDALFIDGVDSEWNWRARKKGYSIWVDKSISMFHMLGEGDHVLGNLSLAIPTPKRTYFQFRNFFWLCRRSYVPFNWKIKNFIKYVIKFFYYPMFCRKRIKYLKFMSEGISHGLLKEPEDFVIN